MSPQKQNLKIAQKIKNTFETNFATLPPTSQEHYALRMYRLTGSKKYLPPIIQSFKRDLPIIIKDIKNFSDQNYQKLRGVELLTVFKTYNIKRKELQKTFYLQNPKVKFLINFLWKLNKLKDFNLNKNRFDSYFSQAQNDLKKLNHQKIFLNHSFFKIDPSEAINTIYFLKNLKITDLTSKIKPLIMQTFLSQKNLRTYQYEVPIYALVHLIISASNFYQNFVSEQRYRWLLNWLEKNLQEIIERTTSDIVAEVGICFKLTHSAKQEVIQKTQDFIIKSFDEKRGFIPREQGKTLGDSQHRNTLAIMLLTDFKKLYKGPDLSKTII